MAKHSLSWDQVVQMCRQAHPEEDEQLVTDAFQADQLDLEAEAEAVERAQGREHLTAARAEIADTRAELVDARATLPEAPAGMAAPLAAPPADAIIHDIADDDDVVPDRFDCGCDQFIMVASFETLDEDALHRQAWAGRGSPQLCGRHGSGVHVL